MACIEVSGQLVDEDTGAPCGGGNVDPRLIPSPGLIGTTTLGSASGAPSLVEVDQFGTYFINGNPAPLNNSYTRQIIQDAILNGPDGAGSGGGGGMTANQLAQLQQRQREFDEATRQFDLNFGLDQQQLDQNAQQFAAQIGQSAEQFNANLQQRQAEQRQAVEQFNARQQQDAGQFNANMQARRDELNAQLQQNAAEFNAQQQQQRDLANQQAQQTAAALNAQIARDQRQLDFAILKEQVATEEGNRSAKLAAQSLIEQTTARVEANQLQRTQLTTAVEQFNANLDAQEQQFNAQQELAVARFNEEARLQNLALQADTAEGIGRLAANASDVGEVAARLRAQDSLTQQIARGENALTERSVAPLGELLGVQEELQRGPAQLQFNPADFGQVAAPEFGAINDTIPELGDLFQPVQFDPSGVGPGPQPVDASQFLLGPGQQISAQQLGPSPEMQAFLASLPPEVAAQIASQAGVAPTGNTFTGPPPDPTAAAAAPQPTAADTQRVIDLTNQGLLPEGTTPGGTGQDRLDKVGTSVSEEAMREFFARLNEFENGGIAPPGMPVVVGDDSQGKENKELAMVDASGNLIVVPIDQLRHAQDGGIFTRADQEAALTRQRNAAPQVDNPIAGIGPTGFFDLQREPTQPRGILNRTTGEDTRSADAIARDQLASQMFSVGATPAALTPDQVIPPQTQQNPLVQSTGATPFSTSRTLDFLSGVGQDALDRFGVTNINQITPIGNSAPGTSNFLKEGAASVAAALGFGPASLFLEQLQALTPVGVSQRATRRTA